MKTLQDLFLDELADMHDAEMRLTKALPKMARTATHVELSEAIDSHFEETEEQVKKLVRIFAAFGKKARGKKCRAMAGLLDEVDEIISGNTGSPTINAALIAAAQKVEHYEIASYGCLREWARLLDNEQAEELLQEILDEEEAADQTLTQLARARSNAAALEGQQAEVSIEDGEVREDDYRAAA